MAAKRKSLMGKFVRLLLAVVPPVLSLVSTMPKLIEYKAQKATNHLLTAIILSILFALLSTVSWICILGFFYLYFISLGFSFALSLFFIFIINILLMVIIALAALKIKKRLFAVFSHRSRE